MGTTAKGIPYPASDDAPDGPAQIKAVADWVDAALSPKTYAQISALAGADLWTGRMVFQSNTGAARPVSGVYEYNGVSWHPPWLTAWGLVTRKTMASDSTGYIGDAAVSGLVTSSFTTYANRLYEVVLRIPFKSTSGSGTPGAAAKILDSADGTIVPSVDFPVAPDTPLLGQVMIVASVDFSAGSHVLTPHLGHTGGDTITPNVAPSELYVKDIGPNGIPA